MITTFKTLSTKCLLFPTQIINSKIFPTLSNRNKTLTSSLTCDIAIKKSIPSFLREYRQLEPKSKVNSLLSSNKYLDCFNSRSRTFIFGRKKPKPRNKKKRIPKLILVQNPLRWLLVKIDFFVLKHVWDPLFLEKEFKFGTKQAISKVTHVISDGQYTELSGLLTKPARLSLLRELDRNWGQKQRSLLALKRDDIQITSPRKVHFIRIADKRFCDVDMAFLALKWVPLPTSNTTEVLLFTEIFARFHREYTPHSIPEWTIAFFKITRFEVLRKINKT